MTNPDAVLKTGNAGLVELRERVRAAKGVAKSDFALNQALERMAYGNDVIPFTGDYTSSIDAALALALRRLPEVNAYGFEREHDGRFCAHVGVNFVKSGHWLKEGFGHTPPLAILDALLSALISKSSASEGES